jgi:G3E family GTPase
MKTVPITILTGFLGAGKTTIVNKILQENSDIKFGLIINEFGEIGIDGQILQSQNTQTDITEMSNGCLCCTVRGDLLKAVEQMADKVDYIIIETSGLAEPKPVADTFVANNLGGKIYLDCVVCVVDSVDYFKTQADFQIAIDQLTFADILVLNKTTGAKKSDLETLKKIIKNANPTGTILTDLQDTALLVDNGKWNAQKLEKACNHGCTNPEHKHSHNHEHTEVDEVVFVSSKAMNPEKLDIWVNTKLPTNVVRAKGIIEIPTAETVITKINGNFLFQMVGASKSLTIFDKTPNGTKIVLIGKHLDKNKLLADLKNCEV